MRKVLAALALLLAVGGCNRPTDDECRRAIDNIRVLTETERTQGGPDPYAAVRSCRANAKRSAVRCMIAAKSRDDLTKCEGGLAKEVSGDD